MMNGFPSRAEVEALRIRFPEGSRVALDWMDDPYREMPRGMKGTVRSVDDAGSVHVDWDNGSSLAAVYMVDRIHKVQAE